MTSDTVNVLILALMHVFKHQGSDGCIFSLVWFCSLFCLFYLYKHFVTFKKSAILLKHIIVVIITIKSKNHKRQFNVAQMVH